MATADVKDIPAKLVTLGDYGVGKSSIILRFVKDEFPTVDRVMLGEDSFLQTVTVGVSAVKLKIFDTNTQERYGALPGSYCRGAASCIVVYDITSKVSFERAQKWLEYLKGEASKWGFNHSPVIALAGNKMDLEDQRQVTVEEAKLLADQNGLIFMETSAKVATNVNALFSEIARRLVAQPVVRTTNTQDLLQGEISQSHPACH